MTGPTSSGPRTKRASTDGRRAKGDRRKQDIVNAAREIFTECGYRRTSLAAIIARSGGSRETIYKTFGGKSGLIAAIIEQSENDLLASVAQINTAQSSPREVLTDFGASLIAIWRTPEGAAINRMILSEGLEEPALMKAWFDNGPNLAAAALTDYFQSAIAKGDLAMESPLQMARMFIFLMMGSAAYPIMSGDMIGCAQDGLARSVDLILAGSIPSSGKTA